jgi:type I protein arginine methyltransferase
MRKFVSILRRLTRFLRRQVTCIPGFSSYTYDLQNAADFANPFIQEEMLADSERVNKYYAAIQRIVRNGDVVVDIGAGTGILSFFAARKAAKVYAVEHSSIIETAKKVCADNNIGNVQFIKRNSRGLTLDRKADVIIHEQIGGANPFSENMIENLLDARRRLLKPGGRIVPNKFEIFLEPVQLKESYLIPFLWEFDIHSISYRSLRPSPKTQTPRTMPITPYICRSLTRDAYEAYLCAPEAVMRFDLETLEEDEIPHKAHYRNSAVRDGYVDGLWFYFKADFDEEISINSSPDAPPNHWTQLIYRLERERVKQGDVLEYELDIRSLLDDNTWTLTWYGARNQA